MSTIRATPAARRIAAENKVDLLKIIPQAGKDYLTLHNVLVQKKSVKISNVAKDILEYYHMNPDALGIHIDGKITKNIVLQAMSVVENKALKMNPIVGGNGNVLKKPITGIRKVIAQKMVESLATAAQYTLFSQFDADKIKNLSSEIALAELELSGNKINITDILIKITAAALVKHPLLNSSIMDNQILMHDSINIGLAVALDDGLIVPVIKNAEAKSLREISTERKNLVDKARKGKLQPDDYTCGTFTISNMGMYPVDYFTPIINQPESAILGVGRIVEKVVPVDGKIEIRLMMGISLTLDHRIIDGAEGAKFLATLKEMFDNPYQVCLTWY
jgi:pyruvate dehydrogenase E2 component (dihydrolipoamide acetyltransferase)